MSSELRHRYSLEEYLALERESEIKHEYWNGEIFQMSGGTLRHDQIMGNLFDNLRTHFLVKLVVDLADDLSNKSSRVRMPSIPPCSSITKTKCIRANCI